MSTKKLLVNCVLEDQKSNFLWNKYQIVWNDNIGDEAILIFH